MFRRRATALAALAAAALAGCGSRDVADYPPPASVPRGDFPPIADLPGRVVPATGVAGADDGLTLDRRRSTLTVAGRTVPTPLEPTSAARVPGGPIVVLGGRERKLAAYDPRTLRELARVPAGTGPSHVVAEEGLAFVADTTARALLVFRTAPELALVHRGALPGAPWGLAVDERRDRIWVTIPSRNRLIGFAAEVRPERLQGFGTVRQPVDVRVEADGTVVVAGRDATQLIDPERD